MLIMKRGGRSHLLPFAQRFDVTDTAKIVRFHEAGGPEVLKIENLPVAEPGPGEVRLRVKAIGINRAEVMFRYGRYFEQPLFPAKNGAEASGIVDAVGPGVEPSWIGKTVSTVPGTFSMGASGVYGEVAIVPVHGIAEYPTSLSFEQGAAIWMQYLTAYGALVWHGKIAKGDFVIVTAASSSVGIAAIQLIKSEGAVSIAVTRTSAKRAELLELGADHVIVAEEEDLVARVNDITQGQGARLVFDAVAGPGVEALAASTAFMGTIFIYGAMATEPTPYPLWSAFGKRLTIRAYTIAEVPADPIFEEAKRYVFERLVSGAFRPVIGRTFDFEDISEAHRFMESNNQIGKIVVRV
jgi:NADPH:quinone reductase-like Zn-dependent oxidoreductase